MVTMNESQLLTHMRNLNPWWVSGEVDKDLVPDFRRNEYETIREAFLLDPRRFPVLSGARRVGKSTLMFQLIDELLRSGKAKPRQILYYSFDYPPNDESTVENILEAYRTHVYGEKDFYLFVDEIQNDASWKATLKQLFDFNKRARAIVCGSSSVELEKKSGESGAGRFLTIKIPTLSFYEFCALNGNKIEIGEIDPFKIHLLPLPEQSEIYMKLSSLSNEFFRYLKLGGFPEFSHFEPSSRLSQALIDQVVSKAIRQDIVKSYSFRDADALSNLFVYLCYRTSDVINVDAISKSIEIDRATCNLFIDALERANLIYVSEQLHAGGKKALNKKRKIYVSDYSIRYAITGSWDIVSTPLELGYAIETLAYKHTRDYFASLDPWLYKVGFMRGEGEKEIDIVIQEEGKDIQYVEAKYRNNSRIKDSDGIVVMGLEGTPGYVITKDNLDFGLQERGKTKLYRIPAVAYAYLLGKAKSAR